MMSWKYVTEQGDTWDTLAFDFYGSEKMMHILINANPSLIDTIVFSSGIEIIVPSVPESSNSSIKAPWDD